ncbi:glycerol-3-phosphate acyltransferase [Fictibacillus sp. KIGAM418]|uniref:Glycerol-3-phosphate acyltransferase n=1 Tax=Fictibacillus marinisediminis TaxID=2878389 RepID=A0A9X2BEU5_9BACL|nr:glycerol-3-phosphate acyltransferase [Fictibacillus marinisediminis]MCK6259359.1 glycerol-3-phosphate acyltransferase [Fictibacillus marinisediminis]
MGTIQLVLYLISCYFIGNIMTGYLVAKWLKGVDLRTEGTGNIGARNAGRVIGPWGFVLTLAGDLLKAALAVQLAKSYFGLPPTLQLAAFFMVIAGHLWPVALKFHGGKGVASFIGGILVFDWKIAAAAAVLFLLLFAIRRSLTVAGLIAFLAVPILHYAIYQMLTVALLLLLISVLVVYVQKDDLALRFTGKT